MVWIEETKENGREPRFTISDMQLEEACLSLPLKLGRCFALAEWKTNDVSDGRIIKRQKESLIVCITHSVPSP